LTAVKVASRFKDGTHMSANRIQVGQVWQKVDNQESFLVTRLYTEALSTFAILRPTGAETAAILRVKIERTGSGQTLPGFSLAHSSEEA
jgi:hypothetical protein